MTLRRLADAERARIFKFQPTPLPPAAPEVSGVASWIVVSPWVPDEAIRIMFTESGDWSGWGCDG